jgi:hypothetical protein
MMQVQPRFGAILLNQLSFTERYSPITTATFQLTDADKTKYKALLAGEKGDEVTIRICDVQSGGLDRAFEVNDQKLDFNEYASKDLRRIDVPLYKLVWSFLQAAPLGDVAKKTIIKAFQDHTKRSGSSGRKVGVVTYERQSKKVIL